MFIFEYVRRGLFNDALQVFAEMAKSGCCFDRFTFSSILSVCSKLKNLQLGRQVHAKICAFGFHGRINLFVHKALIDMYAKCGKLQDALHVFDGIPPKLRDQVSCNSLLNAYVRNGRSRDSLLVFAAMVAEEGFRPTHHSFSTVLKACAESCSLLLGQQIHGGIIKSGFHSHVYVSSAVLDMYAKCCRLDDALVVFYSMPERNVVTWNSIIAAFFLKGGNELGPRYGKEAVKIFMGMLSSGLKANQFTFSSILGACSCLDSLDLGKQVHTHVIKGNFEVYQFVGSCLIHMYSTFEAVEDARRCFDIMPKYDIVTWSSIIAGYAQSNDHNEEEAVKLFRMMLLEGLVPDRFTLSSILSLCAKTVSESQGKQIHVYSIKSGLEEALEVGNARITMYFNCGSIDDARTIFCGMPHKDVVTWSVLISGFAQYGQGKEALQLFQQMQEDFKPNQITFVGVLSACRHMGLVDEGVAYFRSMIRYYGLEPTAEHYACVVDLFARSGCLEEAENFIAAMKLESDPIVWRTLLGFCRNHENVSIAKRAAQRIIELAPAMAGTSVLHSDVYASNG